VIVAQVVYLVVPLLVAGVLHSAAIKRNLLPSLARPLDGGRMLRGRPIFGANKTWRGPVLMVAGSTIVVAAQREADDLPGFDSLSLIDYQSINPLLLGVVFGVSYSLSELPNSFVKRQLGIAPGTLSRRGAIVQYTADQADSVVGGALALWLVLGMSAEVVGLAVLIGFVSHVLFDQGLYAFGVKRLDPGTAGFSPAVGWARHRALTRPAPQPTLLVTGATGSFGPLLAAELLASGRHVTALVRAGSEAEAGRRLCAAMRCDRLPARLSAVPADLRLPGLGLEAEARRQLAGRLAGIVHAAALTRFTGPPAESHAANVTATCNLLTLAAEAPRLAVFAHLSTAFVAGRRSGLILESELDHGAGFLNAYDSSKYHAELIVAERGHSLPVIIVRPTVILATDVRGTGVGLALSLVGRGALRALPGEPGSLVDMVDAHGAAAAAARLVLAPRPGGVYHLAAGNRAPTVQQVIDWLDPPEEVGFVDEAEFRRQLHEAGARNRRVAPLCRELAAFLPFLAYPKQFDTTQLQADLGRGCPPFRLGSVARPVPGTPLLTA
jgi:nucleoside-diphosphate-sugar epimerase